MHQFLDTPDDVIALTIADKITSADLDAMMDRIERRLARQDKLHFFVETRSIDGIEIAGLAAHVVRASPMFAKLRQFGRVAVVADQAWMRVATRIESALLPFVSYRTFKPEQREEALAWVMGCPTP